MKFNTLFLGLLLNLAFVYSKVAEFNAKSFAVGSPIACETEELTKDDKLYYASIPSELLNKKFNCNNYVVAMNADSESKGKYKLVKAIIRDECEDCGPYDVRLSVKAIKDISGSRKSNTFWAIISNDGELVGGPFKPELSEKETKDLLAASGEKKIKGVLNKFTEKAKEMVKKNNIHQKSLPWGEEKKEAAPEKKVIEVDKIITVTTVKKVVSIRTKTTASAPTQTQLVKEVEDVIENEVDADDNEETGSSGGVLTGAFAVSVAAGATLLLYRRKNTKKTYIFGEPIDKYDGNVAKELYAQTKTGQKLKIQIPYQDFNEIAHIQIYSPNGREHRQSLPNIDVYNVHNERAIMSDNMSYESNCSALPLPQEQPKPHAQLPVPSNQDFMMAFSPILQQPDLACIPKENIGTYDPTKLTSRVSDDPYLTHYYGDDSQEIYNSVPKEMNQTYANNTCQMSTDILLEYVDGEDF